MEYCCAKTLCAKASCATLTAVPKWKGMVITMKKKGSLLLTALMLVLVFINVLTSTKGAYPNGGGTADNQQQITEIGDVAVAYGEVYTDPDEVALYLHDFEELPPNFVTKKQAGQQGWDAGEDLSEILPGCSIGGDKFGNLEGLLPEKSGRQYYECDVNYTGGHRGAERLVFSSDGLIYYTEDHYESYTQLYDGWANDGGSYRGNGANDR